MLIFQHANKIERHNEQGNFKADAEYQQQCQKEVEIAFTCQRCCLVLFTDAHEEFQPNGQDEIREHGASNE